MMQKHLYLILAVVAIVAAQSEDDMHIPDENDNQFPPDKHTETDDSIFEGSGLRVSEEPVDVTTESLLAPIEDVQTRLLLDTEQTEPVPEDTSCPKPCLCNIEGDSNNFVVDCSGYDLTELPKSLDPKTTTLNLQNNKLTEVPKDVSLLKNLKVLNVNDNAIMELASGSISELPELKVLKLGNNRLIEYPKDLKNSFGLTKLEELDLGGNDMRTQLTSENFATFKSLRKLILPTTTPGLAENLCRILKESLESVCIGSCTDHALDCHDAPPQNIEEGLLDAVLPGTIALSSALEDNIDPVINSEDSQNNNLVNENSTVKPSLVLDPIETVTSILSNESISPETIASISSFTGKLNSVINTKTSNDNDVVNEGTTASPELSVVSELIETVKSTVFNENTSRASDYSLQSEVIKEPAVQQNSIIETPSEVATNTDADVTVGATTSDTKTGGVDKSVIGIIVAGMVLVVAGITIKKNWSSIKNKFSSSPRAPTDRERVANSNGTVPEEVPLQEKSPV